MLHIFACITVVCVSVTLFALPGCSSSSEGSRDGTTTSQEKEASAPAFDPETVRPRPDGRLEVQPKAVVVTGESAAEEHPLLEVTMKSGSVLTGTLIANHDDEMIIAEHEEEARVHHLLIKADIQSIKHVKSGKDVTAYYLGG